jgi:hypothetical protein
MYYLVTEYELPIFGCNETRKLITIGSKTQFADMYDYHPLGIKNKTHIIEKDLLEDFMKDGFATKSDAENNNELKTAIKNFVGLLFDSEFKVLSDTELLQKYNSLK